MCYASVYNMTVWKTRKRDEKWAYMPKSQKKFVESGSIKAEKHILTRITAKKMKV